MLSATYRPKPFDLAAGAEPPAAAEAVRFQPVGPLGEFLRGRTLRHQQHPLVIGFGKLIQEAIDFFQIGSSINDEL